jgi:hypothetical protein
MPSASFPFRPFHLWLIAGWLGGVSFGSAAPASASRDEPVTLQAFVVAPSQYGIADAKTSLGATLTSRELEVLPQLGDDLFRSIARLPGLAADDFTAQFWVRGAPNRELLARLDGVELIEPFHLKDVDGALSIVDPRAIQQLTLNTGGFTTEFGNRLGGVLTMETKTPTRRRTSVGLSLTGVGAGSEGLFGSGKNRWLVTARRGYPDVALRVAGRDDEVEPRYYDLTAKLEFQLTPEHRLSVHALHAGDTLRSVRTNRPSLRSAYDSSYAWMRWQGKPSPVVSGEAVLSWTQLTWQRDGDGRMDGLPFALRERRELAMATLRNEWTVVPGERILARGGFEVKSGDARYRYNHSRQRTIVADGRQVVVTDAVNRARDPSGAAWGAFGSARVQPLTALVLEPGLRFDQHDYTGDKEWGPRLNAAYTLGRATLRAAWGRHAQAQGLHELELADSDDGFDRAARAEHRVVSIEVPLVGATLRVEAYERLSHRLPSRWENVENGYDLFPEVQYDRVRVDPLRGRARGVEAMVSGRAGAFALNASYALAQAEEWVGGRWVPRARDQRHTWRSDLTYAPNPRWEFSISGQFHTGWPTTDVVYSLANLTNGRRVTVAENGTLYGRRMPAYHRMDLRATRRIVLSRSELRLFLDVFNAYNRKNVIGYDHRVTISGAELTVTRKPREQLPLLPSVGVEWSF